MGSIVTPKNSTRLGGNPWSGSRPLVVPAGDSISEPSVIRHPTTHDVTSPSEGDMSLAKKGYAHEAQTGVRQSSRRPSLRRVDRRLHARTIPAPVEAGKFKIPPFPEQTPAEHDATSPMAPQYKSMSTPRNTGRPLANQLQNESDCRKDGEEIQLTMRVRTTGASRGNHECLN